MIRRDSPSLRWLSILLGFLFVILPMPEWMSALRPFLLALILIFWVLETPQKMSLGRIFIIGLLLDIASFSTLGEHAFRLLIICGLVHQFRSQFRFYPLWQQSVFILLILYADQIVLWFLSMLQGVPAMGVASLFSPLFAFLVWPWLYMLLDSWRMQSRS
jgi:rod shape-determining protein MreD